MIKQYKITEEFFNNNIDLIDSFIASSVNSDTQFFQDLIQEIFNIESPIILLNSLELIQAIETKIQDPDWYLKYEDQRKFRNLFDKNNICNKLIKLTDDQKLTVQQNCLSVICNKNIFNKLMNYPEGAFEADALD